MFHFQSLSGFFTLATTPTIQQALTIARTFLSVLILKSSRGFAGYKISSSPGIIVVDDCASLCYFDGMMNITKTTEASPVKSGSDIQQQLESRIVGDYEPGEWYVTKHPHEAYVSQARYTVWTPDGEDFAHTFSEKNARLIASSHDLLEALKECERVLQSAYLNGAIDVNTQSHCSIASMRDQARDAITKAESK